MIHVYKYAPPQGKVTRSYSDWFAENECQDHEYVLTRTITSNKSIQYRWQCSICGVTTDAIKHDALTAGEKHSAITHDPEIGRRYYAEMQASYEAWRDAHNDANAWSTWYKGYLKSDTWKQRRRAVLQRVKVTHGLYRCEACGGAFPAHEIEVHHLSYELVGREPLFDLVAVCDECHEQLTQWSREK